MAAGAQMMALAVAVATMGAMEEAGAMVATRAVAMGAVAAVVVATITAVGAPISAGAM